MTVGTDKSSNGQGSHAHRDISITILKIQRKHRKRNANNPDQVLKLQERRGGRALKMLCLWLNLVSVLSETQSTICVCMRRQSQLPGTLTNNTSQQFSTFFFQHHE
jgi:hypothetical protein